MTTYRAILTMRAELKRGTHSNGEVDRLPSKAFEKQLIEGVRLGSENGFKKVVGIAKGVLRAVANLGPQLSGYCCKHVR
jgi:hypothetical protein